VHTSFLSRYIGADRLPRSLSTFDIDLYFSLPKDSAEAIKARFAMDRLPNADSRMVAMGAQVVFARATGRLLDHVDVLPKALLRSLGAALGAAAPSIASIRSVYRRKPTAYEHQRWVREHLGLSTPSAESMGELAAFLGTQAGAVTSIDELYTEGIQWMFDHQIVITSDRTVRDLAREAYASIEQAALKIIKAAIPSEQRETCRKALLDPSRPSGKTALEWLRKAPGQHRPKTLAQTLEKIEFLKHQGADKWPLEKIPLLRQRVYAKALAGRPPSDSRRRRDDTQLLEVVCFAAMTLLELTDSYVFQIGRRVSDLVRQAAAKTQERQAVGVSTYRRSLAQIKAIIEDPDRTGDQCKAEIAAIISPLGDLSPVSHAEVVREALTDDAIRVRRLIDSVSNIEFKGPKDHEALRQLEKLKQLHAAGATELPTDANVTVGKVWENLVDGEDRKRALRAFEASTAMALHRALRGGAIWIDHSLAFRERDQMLISPKEWKRTRSQYLKAMKLQASPKALMKAMAKVVEERLATLSAMVESGEIKIEDDKIKLPEVEPLPEDIEPQRAREQIFKLIGSVQLPDLMCEMDALTNFSEALLGRKAYDKSELLALYAAVLADGTDADVKGVAAMIPDLDRAHVSGALRQLEMPGRLDRANQRVTGFQHQQPISRLWGTGAHGSADMMSLDASRHLLYARHDPRRKTPSVGVYTHVTDQHSIVYNQMIVLNVRQAGPAIEGVVQHNLTGPNTRLTRLAVDTHGYTNAAVAIAKLQGFDLCPRMADITGRKLFLPPGVEMPENLKALFGGRVSLKLIEAAWDDQLRTAASIWSGKTSAAMLMQRLGSDAASDPLHKSVDHFGRMLITIFLCDFYTKPIFRRELTRELNRGESVHLLQRVVHTGKIAPERGRRRDERMAISGSHTLLTNLVLAWNTYKMQQVIDRLRKAGESVEDSSIVRMGPAHSSHINFRGLFAFLIERYGEVLLKPPARERRRA
jgi:TnpA family transposase